MKKTIHYTAVLIFTISSIAGCSGDVKPLPSPTPRGPKPAAFSLSISTTGGTGYASKQGDLSKEKWVQELDNITNTAIHVSIIDEARMPVMFAGSDIPDVVGSNGLPTSKAMSGSVESGIFQPLDDLLRQYAPNLMSNVPKAAWDAVSYQGKIMAIPSYLTTPSRRATYIRSDLLVQTGLPVPKTVDELLNVLRAFKKLGVEQPYQMRENLKYADIILGAYDVLPYRDQFELVDGQVQPKFFDVANMEKALQVYKTMYEEGIIAKDFATISSTVFFKNIRSAKAGIWSQNATGLVDFRTSIKQVVPGAKVDIIPSPVGPEGKGGYFYYSPVITAYYLNKNVKPDLAARIIQFFDWQQTPEAATFFTFGLEGKTYTINDGKFNYSFPKTPDEIEEEGWRSGTLWMAKDGTANRLRLGLDQDGQDTLYALDHVLSKEGLPGIGFNPDLVAFARYPDLAPLQDEGPKLIMEHIIKIIYGKEPIADWPKVIEEYKAKGGNEIIKEATERWRNKDGAFLIGSN